MVSKSELQEKYVEYKTLIENFQQLQQNVLALEKHRVELETLKSSLGSISEVKVGEQALMPLGGGIFLFGDLRDANKVIMNVGSGVCVEKNVEEAAATIDQQINEVYSLSLQIRGEVEKTVSRVQELQGLFKDLNEGDQSKFL